MDPQNSGLDCILYRDLKVLLRQSYNSLSQVSIVACSSLSRPAPCASFLDSVVTKFPWSQQNSFLQHIHSIAIEFPLSQQIFLWLFNNLSARSVVLSILCRDNLMCDYWNSYVATLTIVSRHCFYAASSN